MGNQSVPDIRPDYQSPNYDPEKIAPYTLEDPLTFLDGSRVTSPEDWKKRRHEILGIFAREMLGEEPPAPAADELVTELFEEKEDALGGFAVRSQYKMWFRKDKSGPCINWLLLRPRYADKKVPVILFLNYRGNHEIIPDEAIPVYDVWYPATEDHKVVVERGSMTNPNNPTYLPIGMLLSAGYAVMSANYCEISPDPNADDVGEFDQKTFSYTGVFELWGKRDESRTDNTTALGAWAWALSRGLDLAERIPQLDTAKAVVTGCSRLGKAALIAAARDERFAVCVANQCGGGGATLAKRDFGENIATEMAMFSHWYCKAYDKYKRNPAQLLTFDQHLLLAAVAPRRLFIQGFNKKWFDTEGEYLACKAAGCVWEFLGKEGLPGEAYPASFETSAIGRDLAYYHRSEEHGLAAIDWFHLLNFAMAK